MTDAAKCAVPKTVHSQDTTKVYIGRTEPLILCGYHASHAQLAASIKEATAERAD